MKNLIGFLTFFFLCSFTHTHGQTFTNREWVQTGGNPDALNLASSALFPDGSIVVVGNTATSLGDRDILVTKYTAEGAVDWQQTFGGNTGGNDYGIAVRVDADYAVIVAGSVVNSGTGEDIVVAKFDATGANEWTQTWDGGTGGMDYPTALAVDANDDVFVAGATTSTATLSDYAVLRIKGTTGDVEWTAGYNYLTNLQDYATSLVLNDNGDPVVTGASAASATVWEYATVSFDKDTGTPLDTSRVAFPGIGIDEPSAIAKDAVGNIIVVGTADSSGNKNIKTLLLDAQLAVQWVRTYDGDGLEDKGLSVGISPAGDIFVAGYTEKTGGGSDFITLKYDVGGTLLWSQRHQSPDVAGIAKASRLVPDPQGGCTVAGTVQVDGNMDARVIAYDEAGGLAWEQSYSSPYADGATSVLLDGANVYISGISQSNVQPNVNSYATVMYSVYTDTNSYHLDSAGKPDYVDHEVIVRFRPQFVSQASVGNRDLQFTSLEKVVPDSVIDAMSAALGVELTEHQITAMKVYREMTPADSISISRLGEVVKVEKLWSTFVMTLPASLNVRTVASALSQLSGFVDYAEPNILLSPLNVPNDSLISDQAGLIPNGDPSLSNAHINMDGAWDIETGDTSVRVGIYEDPIYWAHPDFGDGTFTGSKIRDGGNYVNNVQLQNVYVPIKNHGTLVAGIVGALRNNNKGIAGIAGGDDSTAQSGVALYNMMIRFDTMGASVSTAGDAIVQGALSSGYGLHVQNHSWGGGEPTRTIEKAVKVAFLNQCVVVAGRGNVGDSAIVIPATLRDDWVMSVGASGTDGTPKSALNGTPTSFFTSYGRAMDFIAPGAFEIVTTTSVPSLSNGAHYSQFTGTSSATPHVAGVAALMLSHHNTANNAPNQLAPEDIENILQNTATDIIDTVSTFWPYFPNYDIHSAWGRINATAALQAVNWPHNYVLHSDTPLTTTVGPWSANMNVYFPYGIDTLPNSIGTYVCQRRVVTRTYSTTLPPNSGVFDVWPRNSSSLGASLRADSNDGYDRHCYIADAVVGNTVNVTSKSYVYYILNKIGSSISMNMEFPCPAAQTKAAYSIHVSSTPVTGILPVVDEQSFMLFPNPTSNASVLRYVGTPLTNPAIEVIDLLGRTIFHRFINGSHSRFEILLPSHFWVGGIYLCRLRSSDGTIVTQKLSKY